MGEPREPTGSITATGAVRTGRVAAWPGLGAGALAGSVALSWGAVALAPLWTNSDVLLAVAAALLAVGLAGLRSASVGRGPGRWFAAVTLLALAAEVVGTTFRVSGVALGVPVTVGVAALVWRSEWRLGDLAILSIVLGSGLGISYLLDAVLHPDTGSAADQAAVGLGEVGVLLTWLAIVTNAASARLPRALVATGGLLAATAIPAAGWAGRPWLRAVAIPAGVILSAGLLALAADVWRSPTRHGHEKRRGPGVAVAGPESLLR